MDTIAALATATGEAALAVVRVSGPETLAVCRRVFDAPRFGEPRYAAYGHVHRPDRPSQPVDEAVGTFFIAPYSYTGEDVAEIAGHGGKAAPAMVLECLLEAGARMAEPGEFTRRAVLNEKLNLAQAEGVLDVIQARSDAGLRAALELLGDRLGRAVDGPKQQLRDLVVAVEGYLDFGEDDDVPPLSREELSMRLQDISRGIEMLCAGWKRGRIAREGMRVALIGKPNVGKSSLLNALLRQSRALVTPYPGTTRDTIEEELNIGGIALRAIDTAGLTIASDPVEQLGVKRTHETARRADVVIYVFDSSRPLDIDDTRVRELCRKTDALTLIAINKSDLQPAWCHNELSWREITDIPPVTVNTVQPEGIASLEAAIHDLTGGKNDMLMVTRLRHHDALRRATDRINAAAAATAAGIPLDLIAYDIRLGLNALGEITGETTTDDILNQIFSDFCIGK